MANTGNTQQQINYGAAVNDGNGDPLRTAFIKTDDNFDNVWLAGPVGSNITITNNTVQVNNTNGNLVLSPNGTGVIQTNSRLLPRLNNTYDFGSTTLKYRTGYFGTGGLVVDGNVSITGNLSAGNIAYTGNVFVGDLQGSVYADDSTIMVDAIDNELFASRATISGNIGAAGNVNASANVVALGNVTAERNVVAIGNVSGGNVISVANVIVGNQLFAVGSVFTPGNVQGAYILGNGSFLTGLPATYGNANVIALLSAFGSNTISTTGNITGAFVAPGGNGQVMYNRSGKIGASPYDFNFDESTFTLYVKAGSFSGEADGTDALFVGTPGYTFLGSDIMAQITGNVDSYSQINFQNINSGSLASGDYILTADNGTDSTYYLDMGIASSNHADPDFFGDTSSKNDAYIYVVADDQAGPSTGGPGNLILGSTNGVIKMFVGNTAQANVVATVESDQLLMSGNIVPATSNVYSLGNSTNQWSDLYVSNATIYMNNVPISLTAGNVLTVDGNDVVTTTANGQTALGNLSVDDNNIYNTQGQGVVISNFSFIAEAETAYVQIPAGNSASDLSVVQKQGNVRLAANTAAWIFDTAGNLTIPNGGYINFVNTGGITQAVNEDLRFTVSDDEEDGWAIQSTVNDGAGNDLTRMQVRYDGVRINTDLPTNNYSFDFRDTGEFDVPKSIRGPVGGNLVISIGDQFGAGPTFIDLQTRSYVGDALISNIRIGDPNVTVSTASGAYNWTFGDDGGFYIPNNGALVGVTANNNGYINWVGNSSGDNNGYTTMQLVPDATLLGNDQYLIIDPTAPGHIHIRAGGTQDNSNADLFLGGENSYFKVNAGANNEVRISANSHAWVFGADSILTVPGEGTLRSIGDTINLQSYNIGTGNVNSVYLGSGGGLGFFDQDIGGNWLEIFRSGAEPEIRVPVGRGNLNIQTAEGITPYNWTFDNTGNLTAPGNISASGNVTANYFIGNGSQLTGLPSSYSNANVATFLAAYGSNTISTTGNITAGNFIGNIQLVGNVQGTQANVSLVAGSYTYTFDNTGYFTLPTVGGDEGGEIHFGIPAANTTLQNSVKIDVYQDRIRFFEGSANAKGAFIDLSQMDSGVGTALGYLNIPQVALSANATAALSDSSKHFYSTTAGNLQITIPDNSNVAFPTGSTLTVVVNAAGNVVVAQGTGVSLYMAGSSTTGNRVVGAYGLASVMKVAANTWVISGTGVY